MTWARRNERRLREDGDRLEKLALALAGAERQARLLSESSPDGVVVTNRHGTIVYANPAAHELVGAQPLGSLAGRDARELLASDDLPGAVARHDAALAGTVGLSGYESVIHADGHLVTIETKSVPYEHEGAPAVLALVRDVTARRAAEAALASSSARERTILGAIGEGVVLYQVASDGTYAPVLVNPAAARILGVRLADLRRLHLVGQFPLLDVDGHQLAIEDTPTGVTARTGRPVSNFVLGVRSDEGAVRWLRINSRPILDDREGKLASIAVSMVDITDEHEARRALEAAHARFSALIEHGSDVITVLDREGVVSYASPAYQVLFGADPVGRISNILEFAHPDDRERIIHSYRRLVATPGAVRTVECRVLNKERQWRTFEITASNRLEDPDVRGVVTTSRDVTERAEVAARLAWEAGHDSLTRLANRGLFLSRLDEALRRAKRTHVPCALIYLDLDGFKEVNDRHGHGTGDHVLVVVANRLRAALRPGDSVARLGGDEFVVLADHVETSTRALEIAERIHQAIIQTMALDELEVTIGCSLGVSLWRERDPERIGGREGRPPRLLEEADEALYLAKAAGRNCCRAYRPAPLEPSTDATI
ncbi:MAG: diguanylate cyclase [Actinomycetota bacterium]|nr:diguanylate cyclase [Actinomycetota bacterium]